METTFLSKNSEKHKVFVSFHHEDEIYRREFDKLFGDHFISVSVETGDIDPGNDDEYVKRIIQQHNITHSTVLFALYGARTHTRKHVDWEIAAGLNKKVGGHKGLSVVLLPSFPVAPYDAQGRYAPHLIYPFLHPRTADNLANGYAELYFWPGLFINYPGVRQVAMNEIIDVAFTKRKSHAHLIDNSHPQYQQNR